MTREGLKRLDAIAGRLQRIGVALSALLGGLVGLAFAHGAAQAWSFAFGGFLSLLWVGMAVMVLSAASGRVPAGAWREGLRLSSRVFLAQTTLYGLAVLALALTPVERAGAQVAQLALAMLPGLYLCSVMAILGGGPLFLSWLPARHDR
ncbi:MAG TPA: hypothetical protein PKD53_01660 [Chloroflexaceae bacterium]|nr:hypothetical protein [Chloroflexaceae bacterium]